MKFLHLFPKEQAKFDLFHPLEINFLCLEFLGLYERSLC